MALVKMNAGGVGGGINLATPDKSQACGGLAKNATSNVTGLTKKPRYIIANVFGISSGSNYFSYSLLFDVTTETVHRIGYYVASGTWTSVEDNYGSTPYSSCITNMTSTGFTYINQINATTYTYLAVYY